MTLEFSVHLFGSEFFTQPVPSSSLQSAKLVVIINRAKDKERYEGAEKEKEEDEEKEQKELKMLFFWPEEISSQMTPPNQENHELDRKMIGMLESFRLSINSTKIE